ncbi:2OG-Fe(II) oxygenase [Microbaculum marinisediminis]|uniref:2OG-Fe(II) oxygenase n=1 Tax=Microbaculum marinisediminis TaxID=2931392 RepID=A0AAW5QZT8_9HYPH|nr:2OG-Fe(II) oxygenase [Microbaculum sp. A6E488]MCT8971780.1 2OG-Fe(II) oxygenase [Microbaculum sp. A6E488]
MNDQSPLANHAVAPNSADEIRETIIRSFRGSAHHDRPYSHWILDEVIPLASARMIPELPFPAPVIDDTEGKRDTHNSTRVFFSEENQAKYPVCKAIAEALQHPETVAAIKDVTGADLDGSSLRIEYAQDRDGFWLEPHTDIGPKRITFLHYLIDLPGAETLGTDIYEDDEAHAHAGTSPAAFNQGFVFVPAKNTWHGFEKRTIPGIRKSIIINYVGPEWRNRQELAFPNDPV